MLCDMIFGLCCSFTNWFPLQFLSVLVRPALGWLCVVFLFIPSHALLCICNSFSLFQSCIQQTFMALPIFIHSLSLSPSPQRAKSLKRREMVRSGKKKGNLPEGISWTTRRQLYSLEWIRSYLFSLVLFFLSFLKFVPNLAVSDAKVRCHSTRFFQSWTPMGGEILAIFSAFLRLQS